MRARGATVGVGSKVSEISLDAGPAKPLVVMCAGTPWGGVTGSDHHLSMALTRHARVLWVDPPVSPVTPARFRFDAPRLPRPRLVTMDNGITRLTPAALPYHTRPGVRLTTRVLMRAQISWALRRLGTRPHAVVACSLDDVLGGWGDGVVNVFYGTDDYVAGAKLMGRDPAQFAQYERRQVARADLVVAISPTLQDRWREQRQQEPGQAPGPGKLIEPVLIPNGVQADAYTTVDEAQPAAGVTLPSPVAGLVGYLSERIDIGLLEAVVDVGCSLLLVGPHDPAWEPTRFAALTARSRVTWTGHRPFAELPSYLRIIDVGITPYADTTFNRASFPLKTLEYLAAGRPVVSTDLPAVHWLGTDLVRTAQPGGFAEAVLLAAKEAHVPELAARRRALAARHSWQHRAAAFADAIGLPQARRPGP
jgi:teichuronic acid biosynthesis glycosyltransferase TuaH